MAGGELPEPPQILQDAVLKHVFNNTARDIIAALMAAREPLLKTELAKASERSLSAVVNILPRLKVAGLVKIDEPREWDDARPVYVELIPRLRSRLKLPRLEKRYMPTSDRVERDLALWRLLPSNGSLLKLDDLYERASEHPEIEDFDTALESLRKRRIIFIVRGQWVVNICITERDAKILLRPSRASAPPSGYYDWEHWLVDERVEDEIHRRLPAAVEAEIRRRMDAVEAEQFIAQYRDWRDTGGSEKLGGTAG